jgi:cytochrome c-type biogenesis protein CcsB
MSLLFLRLALLLYSVGLLHSFLTIITRKRRIFRVALASILVGFINHSMSLFFAWQETGHPPITNYQEALSFFAYMVVFAFVVSYLRYQMTSLSVFVFPLVFLMTLASSLSLPEELPRGELLKSVWFYLHIPSVFLAYAALFLAFATGLMYLIQENELKRKRPQAFYYRLPSLEVCDELGYRALSAGFLLLTLGLISGGFWARQVLAGAWIWDPKIIFTFFVWLAYAAVVHCRFVVGWRGRKAALLSMAAFILVLLNFFLLRTQGLAHRFILP